MHLAVLGLFIAARPAPSSAEVLAGFGQFSLTTAEFQGELGQEFAHRPLAWRAAVGLRYRELALSAGVDFGSVRPWDEARHGGSPFSVGLGVDVRYYLTDRPRLQPGQRSRWALQPYARAGLGRTWISGDGPVTRFCSESSTCTAGYFQAEPSYRGWTTSVGLGLEYAGLTSDGMYIGLWFDAGYQAVHGMEVVERVPRGGLLGLTLGATIGGGRTR